jgi:hypothetical protein
MRALTRHAHLWSAAAGLAVALAATALGACGVASASQPPAAVKSRLPECKAVQLRVLFFGENGAAGTGNTSIGIANVSKGACWLEGFPTVRATVKAVPGKKPSAAIEITHRGPAFLFPAKPPRVVLDHDQPTPLGVAGFRYPAISAGFVILNEDWGGPGLCPEVISLSVRLPGLVADFSLVQTQIFACGSSIAVSPVLGREPAIGAVYEGSGTV